MGIRHRSGRVLARVGFGKGTPTAGLVRGRRWRLQVVRNARDLAPTERLQAMPPGGMCRFVVHLTTAKEVDAEPLAWIRRADDVAG